MVKTNEWDRVWHAIISPSVCHQIHFNKSNDMVRRKVIPFEHTLPKANLVHGKSWGALAHVMYIVHTTNNGINQVMPSPGWTYALSRKFDQMPHIKNWGEKGVPRSHGKLLYYNHFRSAIRLWHQSKNLNSNPFKHEFNFIVCLAYCVTHIHNYVYLSEINENNGRVRFFMLAQAHALQIFDIENHENRTLILFLQQKETKQERTVEWTESAH